MIDAGQAFPLSSSSSFVDEGLAPSLRRNGSIEMRKLCGAKLAVIPIPRAAADPGPMFLYN
jgi:hypothetical protein